MQGKCRGHEPLIIHAAKPATLNGAIHRFTYSLHADGECWTWHGNQNIDGYPLFPFRSREWLGHRWSYAYFIGGHGTRQQLDHVCANTLCVRPDHLFPVSAKENSRLRTKRAKNPLQWITPARYVRQWSDTAEQFAQALGLPGTTHDQFQLAA